MDQLRTILHWLQRQHFWVLSGVVALIALGCWWSAARKLSKLYDTNQKTITSEFNILKTLRGAAFHPNKTINDKQTEETKKQFESVTKLWQQIYVRQREQVPWPPALNKTFRDTVEKLQFNDPISGELRNHYQNYIERHFPDLPKKINARPLDTSLASGSMGPDFGRGGGRFGEGSIGPGMTPGAMPVDDDYICDWSEADQSFIREQLVIGQQPSALRIWVTQEDLWVYHTLLNVIAKTNQAANATRQTNAAVKIVYSLEVGKRAAPFSRQPNRLMVRPAMSSTAGPGMGPESGAVGPPGGGPEGSRGAGPESMSGMRESDMGGDRNGAPLSPADEQRWLLSSRYLDDKGQPIPVAGGGGGAGPGETGAPPDPAAAAAPAPPLDTSVFGITYKRLPVRMVLWMDARWLPQLIATCANEPLRVEVQEVHINTSDIAGMESGGGGGGAGFGGFGGFRGEGGPRGGMGGSPAANLFPDHTGVQNFPSQPHVVNVAIQGTIYIFNKPKPELLQQPGTGPQVASQ